MKSIVLILDLFTPYSTRSSTQLVHFSILNGLNKLSDNLFVIGLYNNSTDVQFLKQFLEANSFKFILRKQKFDFEKYGKNKQLLGLFYERFFTDRSILKDINSFSLKPDYILSCIPSFESGFIGLLLSKQFKTAKFNTIWTDVLTFNGLNSPKTLPFKRFPYKYIENVLIKKSNKVFYLGKTQCEFQKKAFFKYKNKMDFYYPSYFPYFDSKELNNAMRSVSKKTCLYFGSLNSGNRDFSELLSLASESTGFKFFVKGYSKEAKQIETPNLTFTTFNDQNNRIDILDDALRIESSSYISLVFLNSTGFSLPGKLFYYTNLKRPIVVVKDGLFKDDIEAELSTTNRFLFSENKKDDILRCLKIASSTCFDDYSPDFFKPEERYKTFIE